MTTDLFADPFLTLALVLLTNALGLCVGVETYYRGKLTWECEEMKARSQGWTPDQIRVDWGVMVLVIVYENFLCVMVLTLIVLIDIVLFIAFIMALYIAIEMGITIGH